MRGNHRCHHFPIYFLEEDKLQFPILNHGLSDYQFHFRFNTEALSFQLLRVKSNAAVHNGITFEQPKDYQRHKGL